MTEGHSFRYKYPAELELRVRVDKDATLYKVVENFELYLKGCGFLFDGLEVIKNDS